MDMINQIKELEKKAKESDIWKEKYLDLKEEIKAISGKFLMMMAEPSLRQKNVSGALLSIANSMYERLKADDTLNIDSNAIISELKKLNLPAHAQNLSQIRSALGKMAGIQVTSVHRIRTFFYNAAMDKSKSEIKFEKTSFMA